MTKKKIWGIIIAAIIIVAAIIGLVLMLGRHSVIMKGQKLNEYHYSSAGGMNGGYYSETVKRYDDTRALITFEKTEWYYQDPTITEYFVDVSIMDELEGIIRKNKMISWDGKKFTNMFIDDGEFKSYQFYFDDESVSFSSQLYPKKYGNKLAKFNEIIKKYLTDAEKLPGLVNPNLYLEEDIYPQEGILEFYVYFLTGDYLGIRILNGKEEEIEIPYSYKLMNTDTKETLEEYVDSYDSSFTVFPDSRDEIGFSLKKKLDAGHYKVIIGEFEIPFEVK